MASLNINIDTSVLTSLTEKLRKLKDPEYLLRGPIVEVIHSMNRRIHIDGKASDGSEIGTYSPGYMKVRTGLFLNSKSLKRGIVKGKPTNPGTFSRGKKKGQARPAYNRDASTKVIVSLTRNLEKDWTVVTTAKGNYGIGFSNPDNYDKLNWVETAKKKTIGHLTKEEQEFVNEQFQKIVNDTLTA